MQKCCLQNGEVIMPFNLKTLSFIAVALLGLNACKDNKENAQASYVPQAVPVQVVPPEVREVTEWDEYTGRFQAAQRVEIRARVSGYLQDIKFDDGQIIQKNDVLFVIDQRPFTIAMESAQARFELAKKEYDRAKSLHKSKAISEEDFDQRLQQYRITKSDLDDASLNLEFTEVKAPFTGRISRNLVDVGSLISGGSSNATLLTTLVSVSPIEFYFEGSESDVLRYTRAAQNGEIPNDRGNEHAVYAQLQDETDFTHEGKINFLDNELDRSTGTMAVRATFNNDNGFLEPGLFARIRIAMGEPSERFLISPEIIGTEQTRKYVYVVTDENKAVRKYITLGHLTDDGMQIAKSGLNKTDKIIANNLHMIRPGAMVSIMQPAENNDAPKSEEIAQ